MLFVEHTQLKKHRLAFPPNMVIFVFYLHKFYAMEISIEYCVLFVPNCLKSGHNHGPGGPSVNPHSQAGSEQQGDQV